MGLFDWFKRRNKKIVFPTKHKKVKVGLVFGGGGARGFAHLGAIKAFEEYGVDFDFVAGTSAGSIVGALYCAGLKFDQMYDIAKGLKVSEIRKSKMFFMPSKTDGIQDIIKSTLGDITISELKKPFAAVAVDLISSDEVVFTRGSLAKAVAGSCAVPGVFIPVEYENMHLCDGGLQNNIPSDIPRLFGCDYVVAVDVNSTRGEGTESLKMIDVLAASMRIMMKSNSVRGYLNADIVVQPSMKRFKSTKKDGFEEMIEEGYNATVAAMPDILNIISKKQKDLTKKTQAESYKTKIY